MPHLNDGLTPSTVSNRFFILAKMCVLEIGLWRRYYRPDALHSRVDGWRHRSCAPASLDAGQVARSFVRRTAGSGHRIFFGNSRGPQGIAGLPEGCGQPGSARTLEEVADAPAGFAGRAAVRALTTSRSRTQKDATLAWPDSDHSN
jgi:hypothetical protein